MFPLRRRARTGFNPLVTMIIVIVWAVLLGILLKDHYIPARGTLSDKGFQISPAETDDWFILRMGGAYAGFARSRQFRGNGDWTLRDDLNISLNIQGQLKSVKIASEAHVDESFRLISFHWKVLSGIISFDQKGHMEGRELVLEVPRSQGGGTRRLKLYETPRIARSLGLPVPLTGLQVGEEIHIPVFDPLDGNKWDAVIRVTEKAELEINGKKIPTWRVRATFRSIELTLWIDDEGRLLKGQMPLNFTVVRSDKTEIARQMRGPTELPDVVSMSSVPLEGSIPEKDDLQLVRLQVIGKPGLSIPSDDFRQKVVNSELTISRESQPHGTYTLPCVDAKLEQYLVSSRFIRSDDSDIIKMAREIVGDEKDPVKAAALINQWVFKTLRKVPTASLPDAHTVLMTKQGACNEHAVLAVSLARAVGLPAQVAVGLVHLDSEYFYHAWVAYWAGDKWFTGDPLTGHIPVGPSYVTLLYGDVDKHVNVVSFLGQLKLKVLETK